MTRRLPVGAEYLGDGVTHFRVWAPRRRRIELVLAGPPERVVSLDAEEDGWFAGTAEGCGADTRYRFRLDGSARLADPASRWQPDGPRGPSAIVDPASFLWSDRIWPGPRLAGQVLCELHTGTFTPQGTWDAAREKLPLLADAGITMIELMPVADFPGGFGWGYDGVMLFAPYHRYGPPDALRRFVDAAHGLGMGVILDVVYNHLGPDGNVLPEYSDRVFSRDLRTDWGPALDFDGPGREGVRAFVLANVRYWVDEFHMDGFRLDATQDIHDRSDEHIVAAIGREARSAAAGRDVLIFAENEPQDTRLVRATAEGGFGLDAVWNDDFHHTAVVALTGRRQGYYTDYGGSPAEFVAAARHGFLYQGQRYGWQKKRRGTPTRGVPRAAFVNFLENHDQIANSDRGERLHALSAPGGYRALTAVLLLSPGTPLLFQGQEFGSTRPFIYFADHVPELAASVRSGRAKFLRQFPHLAVPEVQAALPDPGAEATFEACKLDWSERDTRRQFLDLHRDLLRLRREDPVLSRQGADGFDGATLAEGAFVLRFTGVAAPDRLLVVNLGPDVTLERAPEPLLGPPLGAAWRTMWCSEHPRYGGRGCAPVERGGAWRLPGHAAALLAGDVPDPQYRANFDASAPEGRG